MKIQVIGKGKIVSHEVDSLTISLEEAKKGNIKVKFSKSIIIDLDYKNGLAFLYRVLNSNCKMVEINKKLKKIIIVEDVI